jgi:hypothetical protein
VSNPYSIDKALAVAVAAIYFNDGSDYETALWQVVKNLGGDEAVDLLESDAEEAFRVYASHD